MSQSLNPLYHAWSYKAVPEEPRMPHYEIVHQEILIASSGFICEFYWNKLLRRLSHFSLSQIKFVQKVLNLWED